MKGHAYWTNLQLLAEGLFRYVYFSSHLALRGWKKHRLAHDTCIERFKRTENTGYTNLIVN